MKNKTQWDLSGGETTIDLLALKAVLAQAVANARDELDRQERNIADNFEKAFKANRLKNKLDKYNEDEYHALCAANTEREWLLNAAVAYSDAIEAYFHICEAIKRREIKIYRGGLTFTKWDWERIQGE